MSSTPIGSLAHPRSRETFRNQPVSNIQTIDLNLHKRSSVLIEPAIREYSNRPLGYGNGTSQSFTYSTGGDLLTQAQSLSGTSNIWTNTYTKAHQLLSESVSNAGWQYQPAVFETISYSAANNLNQYVTVTQGANPTVTLFYDANGNLTADGTWAFAYDAENRLRTAAKSGTTATYLYDPLGRRQAKVVNSVTTSFLSGGHEEIAEYDGSSGLLRRYVPGPATDQPIVMVTETGGTLLHTYFHVNRQGSTVAMSNDSGTVSEGPYTYDAYGQGAPLTGVPFKYTGRRLDAETGLYYYRARYYSASLGRFLQIDPIGYRDQINLYAYVGNDPGNACDPNGLKITCDNTGSCRNENLKEIFDLTPVTDAKIRRQIADGIEQNSLFGDFQQKAEEAVENTSRNGYRGNPSILIRYSPTEASGKDYWKGSRVTITIGKEWGKVYDVDVDAARALIGSDNNATRRGVAMERMRNRTGGSTIERVLYHEVTHAQHRTRWWWGNSNEEEEQTDKETNRYMYIFYAQLPEYIGEQNFY